MKKLSFLLVVVLLASVALSACAPAAATVAPEAQPAEPETVVVKETVVVEPTAAPEGPVTLTFWHAYNETSAENEVLTKTLIPQFEASHPNIKVQALSVPYEDFHRKLITAISGGVAPDLIRSDIVWVPELANMGALVALDEAMSDFADIQSQVFPGPLSTNQWKGHYYGLPLDTNTKVLLYNQEMFDAAGITAPAAKLTDLEEQCQAIKKSNPDAYAFAADGTFGWVVLPWIWSMGGDIMDADMTTATGYINGPKTVAAYDLLLKLYDEGCIAPVIMGNGVDVWTGFAQDTYANLDNGPWTYPIIQSQFPDKKIYASAFPAGEGGSIEVVGGEDVVLFQQSKHPEEAMEFMRFLLSSDYQLKMAEVGQIPVLTNAAESDYMKNHEYYPAFMEQLKTAKARPAHPSWAKIDEIITDAGQLILRKEMTPQAALDAAAAKIDAILQQQ